MGRDLIEPNHKVGFLSHREQRTEARLTSKAPTKGEPTRVEVTRSPSGQCLKQETNEHLVLDKGTICKVLEEANDKRVMQ